MRTWLWIVPLSLALSACNDHHDTRAEAEADIEQAVSTAIGTPENNAREFNVAVRIAVRDRISGAPVAGATIANLGYMGRKTGDDGVYTGTALILQPQGTFSIYCRSVGLGAGELLVEPRYSVLDGRIDVVVDIDAVRCGPPPPQRRARFAGMYVPEFEGSTFFPCDGLPIASTKRFHTAYPVWAELSDEVERGLIWAYVRERISGQGDGFYVEWTGTLTGPGNYGHFGMSLYELDVETIHNTSNHQPVSCKAPGYAESLRKTNPK
jgi:hypothetical protein